MIDWINLSTLIAVLLLGAILTYYNRRQADALDEMAQSLSDWHLMQVAERRERQRQAVRVDNPILWITQQAGATVTTLERSEQAAQAVAFLTDNATVSIPQSGKGEFRRDVRLPRGPA